MPPKGPSRASKRKRVDSGVSLPVAHCDIVTEIDDAGALSAKTSLQGLQSISDPHAPGADSEPRAEPLEEPAGEQETRSANFPICDASTTIATQSDAVLDPNGENVAEIQWVDSLTTDSASVGCALDERSHAAAPRAGARLSIRLPKVSRLVKMHSFYIADDEPTGATFAQILKGQELWPVPVPEKRRREAPPASLGTFSAKLYISPIVAELGGQTCDRFLTRMRGYPLLKGTALQKTAAQCPAADITSLVAPFVANFDPNEQLCLSEAQGETCRGRRCPFQHLFKPSVSLNELTAPLLDCLGECDREALSEVITARAKAGATPVEILRHITLEGGPSRLDSLVAASSRRWWKVADEEHEPALRELAGRLAEFVRLPGTTSLAAQMLVQRRAKTLFPGHVVRQAVEQMTLTDQGRLDERSDKALELLRDALTKKPNDMPLWHVYVDLCLLRIPREAIEQRRALLDEALRHEGYPTPILWWKRLAIERHSGPTAQLAVLQRMLTATFSEHYPSFESMHVGNVLYATQRVVGAVAGPAVAIGYLCALLSAPTKDDACKLATKDPVAVGREGASAGSAEFKYGALLRELKPRYVVLLATAMAHWMTFGVALPVEGPIEIGGAFSREVPLALLLQVPYPRVLRCLVVFQGIAEAFKRRVPSEWKYHGAYLAVVLNMVRCGWLHLPGKPMDYVFRRLGDDLSDTAAYLAMLKGQDSTEMCHATLSKFVSTVGPGQLTVGPDQLSDTFDCHRRGGMRVWHMLRAILRDNAWRRVSNDPDATSAWVETLGCLAEILKRFAFHMRLKHSDVLNWSGADCAVAYVLETLLERKSASWPGPHNLFSADSQTLKRFERLETSLVQAYVAMELVATAREPARPPATALLVLGNLLRHSAARPSYDGPPPPNWLLCDSALAVWPHPNCYTNLCQIHESYHNVARRYFEFGLPFSISCASQAQSSTPCDSLSDCVASGPCAACEDALALTPAHCRALVSGAKWAPIELFREACERLLFGLMGHSGVLVESVDSEE